MNIAAVIFDLDGLLSDSEILHMRAYQDALKNQGIILSDDAYVSHWITKGSGIQQYAGIHGLNLDISRVRREKAEVFDALLNTDLKAMPYAIEIVTGLFKKTKLALASSSYRNNVESIVEKLFLKDYFEVVVTGSDVLNTKPSPDIFILTAEKLAVEPENCIVIEDAEKGIRAAVSAGMKSIAVPNIYTAGSDFSGADFVVDSLKKAEDILLGLI